MQITVAIAGGGQRLIDEFVRPIQAKGVCQFIVFGTQQEVPASDTYEYVVCASDELAVSGAIAAIQSNKAQILMKGAIHTSTLLRAVLQKENQLRSASVLSQVSVISFKDGSHRWVLSDPGLNISPDVKTKIAITKNAIAVAHNIGIKTPRVAVLSAVEEVSAKLQSSVDAKAVADYFKTSNCQAVVEGPLSMDIATDPVSAVQKKYAGRIQGNADVLIVPNIESGNLMYKTITRFIPSVISGAIIGAKVPIILTSRSDSMASKEASLQLALLNCKQPKEASMDE